MNVLSILGLPESVGLGILALGAALVLAAALGEVKIPHQPGQLYSRRHQRHGRRAGRSF
jgi:hypothetical protein